MRQSACLVFNPITVNNFASLFNCTSVGWASDSGVRRRRRRQQCLNIFSSETALPIKAKFYVEPPWEGGTKVYINGPGHMTKMAAMPIYGKNL